MFFVKCKAVPVCNCSSKMRFLCEFFLECVATFRCPLKYELNFRKCVGGRSWKVRNLLLKWYAFRSICKKFILREVKFENNKRRVELVALFAYALFYLKAEDKPNILGVGSYILRQTYCRRITNVFSVRASWTFRKSWFWNQQ